MFRLPSPSLVISLLALIVALGGAAFSANGGNFILGQTNNATAQTRLVGTVASAALRVDNSDTSASAVGIRVITDTARAPFAVNSSVKVENLNADELDGIDSTELAHRLTVSFNVASGANSAVIPLPIANRPIFLAGVTLTVDLNSVGQVTLLKVPGAFVEWVGLESTNSGSSQITSDFSGATGTHVVYIDFDHKVEIQVAGTDAIRIHNAGSVPAHGNLTFIW